MTWQLDLIGRWKVAVLAFGLVCVAGSRQESSRRGVMRSLDNFFKAASNNSRCEGAWPPQLAGTRGRERGKGAVSVACVQPCEDFLYCEIWDLWCESCEMSQSLEPPTSSEACISVSLRHTLCILINPPKLSEERKRTWQSGREHRGCGGDKEWLGSRPSQSAA